MTHPTEPYTSPSPTPKNQVHIPSDPGSPSFSSFLQRQAGNDPRPARSPKSGIPALWEPASTFGPQSQHVTSTPSTLKDSQSLKEVMPSERLSIRWSKPIHSSHSEGEATRPILERHNRPLGRHIQDDAPSESSEKNRSEINHTQENPSDRRSNEPLLGTNGPNSSPESRLGSSSPVEDTTRVPPHAPRAEKSKKKAKPQTYIRALSPVEEVRDNTCTNSNSTDRLPSRDSSLNLWFDKVMTPAAPILRSACLEVPFQPPLNPYIRPRAAGSFHNFNNPIVQHYMVRPPYFSGLRVHQHPLWFPHQAYPGFICHNVYDCMSLQQRHSQSVRNGQAQMWGRPQQPFGNGWNFHHTLYPYVLPQPSFGNANGMVARWYPSQTRPPSYIHFDQPQLNGPAPRLSNGSIWQNPPLHRPFKTRKRKPKYPKDPSHAPLRPQIASAACSTEAICSETSGSTGEGWYRHQLRRDPLAASGPSKRALGSLGQSSRSDESAPVPIDRRTHERVAKARDVERWRGGILTTEMALRTDATIEGAITRRSGLRRVFPDPDEPEATRRHSA